MCFPHVCYLFPRWNRFAGWRGQNFNKSQVLLESGGRAKGGPFSGLILRASCQPWITRAIWLGGYHFSSHLWSFVLKWYHYIVPTNYQGTISVAILLCFLFKGEPQLVNQALSDRMSPVDQPNGHGFSVASPTTSRRIWNSRVWNVAWTRGEVEMFRSWRGNR